MPPKAKSWGYVYIVRSLEHFKIGWSSNLKTLKSRLNRLRLMNAYNIEPVFIIRSRRAHKIERELHEFFSDKRLHGEWFCLDEKDKKTIATKYHRGIYTLKELGIE